MFTGLVEEVGTVRDLKIPTPDGGEMTIHADAVFRDIRLGDNIAVNGTCLTVTWFDTNNKIFKVGIAGETLKKTCIGRVGCGSLVNLERSLQTCTRMRGHVDAVGMESSPATASKKGGDRSNVRWTEPMDKVLIQVLFNECVTGGRRSDNTWKPEALNHVVTEVNKIKFGTPVVTKNVRFRLKTLKKEYRAAKKALNQSGFSYNHESGCIEADEQVWDEYIKAHPDAAPLRSRKFPYYKNLAIICGNEQPPGYLNFEGNNISPLPITTLNGAIDDGAAMNLDEDMSQIHGSSSTSTPPKVTTTPQKRKRNRAAEEKIKVSFEALAEAAKDIANSFRPVDFAGLNGALRVLPGLSSEDRLRALDMFAEKKELAAIFFGFEEELRLEWLRRKLS